MAIRKLRRVPKHYVTVGLTWAKVIDSWGDDVVRIEPWFYAHYSNVNLLLHIVGDPAEWYVNSDDRLSVRFII